MGHYSKGSEKPPLTESTLHGCRTPKARMSALFSKDMEINHGDDAVNFKFIEFTSSVHLAELLVENFRQSVEHGPLFKAAEKPLLTGSTLHRCRTQKARMFALFSKGGGRKGGINTAKPHRNTCNTAQNNIRKPQTALKLPENF